jgi:hypothetical protein
MTDLRPITLAGDPAAVRTLPGTSLPGPGGGGGGGGGVSPPPPGGGARGGLGTATGRLR